MRKLTFSAPLELLDALSGTLFSAGAQGLEEGPGTLTAYVMSESDEQALTAAALELNASHPGLAEPIVVQAESIDDSWQQTWQEALVVVRLTERWTLRPTHHAPAPPGENTIWFQPEASFGDGSHATTQLAAHAIERWFQNETNVAAAFSMLDFGTGNGVLSLLALMECALHNWKLKRLLAIDIDEVAVTSFHQNLAQNALVAPELELRLGGLHAADGTFDLVVANISARVLLDQAAVLARAVSPRGTLFLTGLLEEDEAAVLAAYGAWGLELASTHHKTGWSLLQLSRAV